MRITKRMLAFLLSVAMLVSMVATVPTAFAADDVLASFSFEGENWTAEDSGAVTATPDAADKITQVADGKNGAAANFTGLDSHQGLRWSSSALNPFAQTGDQASVSMWVKFHNDQGTIPGQTTLFNALSEGHEGESGYFIIKYNNSRIQVRTSPASNGGGNNEGGVESYEYKPAKDEWVLITYVQNGKNGKLYFNDELVGEGTVSATLAETVGNYATTYAIGCQLRGWWGDPSLNGAVDDFTVYNKALSVLEIAALAGGVQIDQAKVDAASDAIEAIGTVALDDASLNKIKAAQAAYDVLTDVEKAYVDDAALVAAWEAYYTLAETENDGLLLYLDFEDGKATDIEGRVDATVSGVTTTEGREAGSTAFQFSSDKSRNENMYVRWNGAAYDPFARTENGVTINTWVKMQATDDWATLFSYGKGDSFVVVVPQADPWNGHNNAFRAAFKNNNSGESQAMGTKITTEENLGKWVMLTITQDKNRNTKMYVGGKLVGEGKPDYTFYDIASSNDPGSMNYNLGIVEFFGDDNFQGAIDEFAIYNRTMNEEEVAGLAGIEYDKAVKIVTDFVCYDDRANSNTGNTPMSESWRVTGNVEAGDRVYYDRTGITLKTLPEGAAGGDLIAPAMSSKSNLASGQTALEKFAEFKVKQRASVYIAVSSGMAENSALVTGLLADGYEKIDGQVDFNGNDGKLDKIYKKTFAKGAIVDLPAQYNASSNMYVVFVQAEEELPVDHDFTVTNTNGAVTASATAGKFDITWNANIVLDEGVDLAALNEKATFTEYGVVYGTDADAVAAAIAAGEDTATAKIKSFDKGDNIDVYTIFGFRLKGVAADKSRAAQFYVTYTLDGESYTVYSDCVAATAAITE